MKLVASFTLVRSLSRSPAIYSDESYSLSATRRPYVRSYARFSWEGRGWYSVSRDRGRRGKATATFRPHFKEGM